MAQSLQIRFCICSLLDQWHNLAELRSGNEESIVIYMNPKFASHGCCCVYFPCFASGKSDSWERISIAGIESEGVHRSWWDQGISACKKLREWSELVAGPKWKTFFRRFNKTARRVKPSRFQYDPLSYALNFDEGPAGKIDQFNGDMAFWNFSARYAAIWRLAQSGQEKNPPHVNVT